MTDTPNIQLFNKDNILFLDSTLDMYDFIYADCLYLDDNIDWVYHALPHLKYNGIFIVQTDYHTVAKYKTILDDIDIDFKGGSLDFLNWLIYMNNWGGTPTRKFAQKHDDILVYCKGKNWKWYPERIQIPKATAGTAFDKKGTGTKTPPSVFYDHISFSTMSGERIEVEGKNFPMQKPEWLMERLLLPFTDEGDSVLDLFMGTGTMGVVCKKHRRNYTGIENDTEVFNAAKERIG